MGTDAACNQSYFSFYSLVRSELFIKLILKVYGIWFFSVLQNMNFVSFHIFPIDILSAIADYPLCTFFKMQHHIIPKFFYLISWFLTLRIFDRSYPVRCGEYL